MKIARVCDTCWNEDLSYSGSVEWSVSKQEYIVADINDSTYCHRCENDVSEREFEVDEKNSILYPSVEEVCTEGKYEASHMLARARVVAYDEHNEHEDIDRLFKAILETGELELMIVFLNENSHCDHLLVEEKILAQKSPSEMHMYLRTIGWGNRGTIFDALVQLAVEENDFRYLDGLVNGSRLQASKYYISDEHTQRAKAVYALLGGTIPDGIG